MTTVIVVAFLAVHGLLHLAIWLPHQKPDPAAAVHVPTIHRVAVGAAVSVAAAYVLSAMLVGLETRAAVAVTVLAAILGLVQKTLFFHPWLSLGVLIDAGVLVGALTGWTPGL